jgi:DNA-binding response OmpR family regulator
MIVIEDAELANLIGLVLHHRGYQVHLARSVVSACEQFASVRPDLLIASKRQLCADRNAYYTLQATRGCPLLWIGDTVDSTAEARFRTDHLSIPFGAQELVKRVEEVMANDQSARRLKGTWPNHTPHSLSKLSRPDSSLDKHILP